MSRSISQSESRLRLRFDISSFRRLTEYLTGNRRIESRIDENTVADARRRSSLSDILLQEDELSIMQLHDIRQRTARHYKKND
jgi:hypothetical protein